MASEKLELRLVLRCNFNPAKCFAWQGSVQQAPVGLPSGAPATLYEPGVSRNVYAPREFPKPHSVVVLSHGGLGERGHVKRIQDRSTRLRACPQCNDLDREVGAKGATRCAWSHCISYPLEVDACTEIAARPSPIC